MATNPGDGSQFDFDPFDSSKGRSDPSKGSEGTDSSQGSEGVGDSVGGGPGDADESKPSAVPGFPGGLGLPAGLGGTSAAWPGGLPGERPTPAQLREEERRRRQRRQASEILLEARERLVGQLCDEIISNRDAILGDASGDGVDSAAGTWTSEGWSGGASEGLFGFEYQELEERFSVRLQALNSILDNLEYRRPRIVHRFETFRSTPERLTADLHAIVQRYDQWDLVDIDITRVPEEAEPGATSPVDPPASPGALLVVVGFTAVEFID